MRSAVVFCGYMKAVPMHGRGVHEVVRDVKLHEVTFLKDQRRPKDRAVATSGRGLHSIEEGMTPRLNGQVNGGPAEEFWYEHRGLRRCRK